MNKSIYSVAQETIDNYRDSSKQIDVVEGLSIDMYQIVRETEFLSSGHYLNGDYDEDGILLPFQDIITRILENQRSAEEVDTADMRIKTDDQDFQLRALLIDKYNQDWLYNNRVDKFLNDAIETRGKYGGLLVKVLESDDNIELQVGDWNAFAGDAVDLQNGIKVFNHYYTPAELLDKASDHGWDIDACKEAIRLYAENTQSDDPANMKETVGKYVLVREVTGVMERDYVDENADEYTYSKQLHYLAGTELKDGDGKSLGKTLFSEELDDTLYYYLPYKKRGSNDKMLGIGMVERSKQGQVQTNRATQNYTKALDLASTHVLQSASKNLKGKNVIRQLKTGTILQHDDGKPITGVNMVTPALQFIDNYLMNWQNIVDRATGTYSVATGEDLPSGTPYRLGAILDQNAQSSFDLRREEFGIFLNQIYLDRIIPFFIKQIKKSNQLNLKFNPEELIQIDTDISNKIADQIVLDNYFSGVYSEQAPIMRFQMMQADRALSIEGTTEELKKGKDRRKILNDMKEEWRKYWSECEGKLYIEITNEKKKKGVLAESINNVLLQYMQYKPQLDADPEARKIFNELLGVVGMKPIDFSNSPPAQGVPAGGKPEQVKKNEPLATSAKPR
jgi:hypothetical protein